MSFVAPILRTGLRSLGKYIYTGLRYQDKLVDVTYRKTGLYNRGVVRGIKHGLAGGQIIGGGLSLGLNADESPGNSGKIPYQKQPTSYKQNKARSRRSGSRRTRDRCYTLPRRYN